MPVCLYMQVVATGTARAVLPPCLPQPPPLSVLQSFYQQRVILVGNTRTADRSSDREVLGGIMSLKVGGRWGCGPT